MKASRLEMQRVKTQEQIAVDLAGINARLERIEGLLQAPTQHGEKAPAKEKGKKPIEAGASKEGAA